MDSLDVVCLVLRYLRRRFLDSFDFSERYTRKTIQNLYMLAEKLKGHIKRKIQLSKYRRNLQVNGLQTTKSVEITNLKKIQRMLWSVPLLNVFYYRKLMFFIHNLAHNQNSKKKTNTSRSAKNEASASLKIFIGGKDSTFWKRCHGKYHNAHKYQTFL